MRERLSKMRDLGRGNAPVRGQETSVSWLSIVRSALTPSHKSAATNTKRLHESSARTEATGINAVQTAEDMAPPYAYGKRPLLPCSHEGRRVVVLF